LNNNNTANFNRTSDPDLFGNVCRAALYLVVSWICFVQVACESAPDEKQSFVFRIHDSIPEQRRILNLQDRHERDTLVTYLRHPDPSLRYRAAMAFGSIRDSSVSVLAQLTPLLTDVQPEVRVAAAYAMGQSQSRRAEEALIKAFRQRDSTRTAALSNGFILEAIGKTGSAESLLAMSTTKQYLPSDSMLMLGQARGIYRFALRGIVHPDGTARMVEIVTNKKMPAQARLIAANYLFRATGISTEEYVKVLSPLAENDNDPRIRMCLVVALAKSRTPEARTLLLRIATRDSDYRVRCNVLKSLHYFPYAQVHDVAFQLVEYKNLHVARCAAEYILEHGEERDAAQYRSLSKGQMPWEVKSVLYGAANRYLTAAYGITKGNLNAELVDWYRRSMNPYEKAAVLGSYAMDASNYKSIPGLAFGDKNAHVRTAAVDALGSILNDKYFARDIGTRVSSARREITDFLIDAIKSGDAAMIASAATTIADAKNDLYDYARAHLDALEKALIRLELPREIETYHALADCLAKLKKETYQRQPVAFNHPIDWDAVLDLPDTVKVEVLTSRGSFKMVLYSRQAPGTVMNFVQLARDRFYNGKNFHRVVPNFVVQGGCPRGDGYGSLDYTIRSELPPAYYNNEGYVGMASAGNHTEGTQWFITHSPTPHLDGNYTLFGRVTEGMSVVHRIQIGDEITEVNIL
jgi:cyclophilin family peptidyl-prolyl cis-trans isomerase/HEAT repeat protein